MAREWCMMDNSPASKLFVDGLPALSIAKRQGAGKMRRINVKTLWLQEKAVQLELEYIKVKGEEHPADGLSKHVKQGLAEKYLDNSAEARQRSSQKKFTSCRKYLTQYATRKIYRQA